jgi:hypothetical protein
MTYKDYFVAEIKHNGRILRMVDDCVRLPFGSEYSILLKNLNTRTAAVNVSIDGQDVLDHHRLLIPANQTIELNGFMKNNVVKNRFKFIEKTDQISEHRGDRVDDGIVRIQFAFEKQEPVRIRQIITEQHEHHHHHHHHRDYYYPRPWWSYTGNRIVYNSSDQSDLKMENMALNDVKSCDSPEHVFRSVTAESLQTPINDMGITVKGSEINEQYHYGMIGQTDPPQAIVIRLKGSTESGKVQQPVTVQTKLTCSSCGTKSKSSFKYCPNCGTFLE